MRISLVDIPLRVKNTAGTGPLNVSEPETQTCQSQGRVQTKHAVLQPIRADFQRQVMECGKVNDKDSRESTLKLAYTYFSTHTHREHHLVWLCTGPLDLCLPHAYIRIHRNIFVKFTRRSSWATYKFKDEWDIIGHHTKTLKKHEIKDTKQWIHKDVIFCSIMSLKLKLTNVLRQPRKNIQNTSSLYDNNSLIKPDKIKNATDQFWFEMNIKMKIVWGLSSFKFA